MEILQKEVTERLGYDENTLLNPGKEFSSYFQKI